MGSPRIAVIGAGFGGIAAVVALKQAGYHDVIVFEKGDEVGGVWRANTYPEAACDVPSPFYSYSFAPNPRWPHRFSRQSAIQGYLNEVVDSYAVRGKIRFGAQVTAAAFEETPGKWTVRLRSGDSVEVDMLVTAVGQLSRPAVPRISGLESFEGASFHSAEWDHSVDLDGLRVAVIGTGASAIQFVPAIQPQVGHLEVFQRSAPYLLPRPDREYSPLQHKLFQRLPATLLAERGIWYGVVEGLSVAWVYSKPLAAVVRRVAYRHMRRQAAARPGLFERVWPDYPVGCKRVLFSSDYLPALTQPNVDLVTEKITKITRGGIVTTDGAEHPADLIIWGTGFRGTEFLAPMQVTGLGGRDLHEQWSGGARAYYGMTVPHFPNLLIMYGPNTNSGSGSIIYFLEAQARYLRQYVDRLVASGAPITLRPEVEASYDQRIQAELASSVWSHCSSWYHDANGRITTNWPRLGIQYHRQASFNADDYEVVRPQAFGLFADELLR
jgi:cation diffusion facilitator CzcD-associated flavoprotein CzcO